MDVLWLTGSAHATCQALVAWVLSQAPVSRKEPCIPGAELGDGLAQARKSLGRIWLLPLYHQLGVNSSTPQLFQTTGHDRHTESIHSL